MKDEADFTSLYDYNDISNLSEKEKIVYLEDVTKRYLLAKSEILQKRNINFQYKMYILYLRAYKNIVYSFFRR